MTQTIGHTAHKPRLGTLNRQVIARQLRLMLGSFPRFTSQAGQVNLYRYQQTPAAAILDSVRRNLGLTFVLILPRQSGKDELMCQLKVYLMRLLSNMDRSMVEVNPTYKPQTINAILRLENRLSSNRMTRGQWGKRSDHIRMIGGCRTTFLSGDGSASVVGATADLMLIVNEAQDISPAVYDKNFAPMCASTNATRVFCGTVWTSHSLLSREKTAALQAEKRDGIQRVFLYTAEQVGLENKRYAAYVAGEVARQGRNHPFIKTQYFCEEVDAEAGMFNPGRRALMQADQPAQSAPVPGGVYAFLLDIAGQDESNMSGSQQDGLVNAGRDSLALSIVSIDLSSLTTLQAPTYRVVHRHAWQGLNHLTVFGQVKALADAWKPQHFVVDASGVGEGFWAMLDRTYPGQVRPVKFSLPAKSEIGWRFLSIIETGRFRDCSDAGEAAENLSTSSNLGSMPSAREVRLQYDNCTSEILPGPNKVMRWGVPEGRRGPDGELLHDDLLVSDALVAVLDELEWHSHSATGILHPLNPSRIDRNY